MKKNKFIKRKLNIVIFGDSIVGCSNLKLNKRWTQILIKKFNKIINFKVVALNGGTSTDAIKNINLILRTKKIEILILSFGINDSVYWISKAGKPLVNLNKFENNIKKIIKKVREKHNAQTIFITSHKFLQKRLEGNGKTHNDNYKNYKNQIAKISKKFGPKVIDMEKNLKAFNPKKYCLPLPDGLHLNNFGSLKYSVFVSKFIINQLSQGFK